MSEELPMKNISRNFPGVAKEQYYTLEELMQGDLEGTTETDSATEAPEEGYTRINRKKGKPHSGKR